MEGESIKRWRRDAKMHVCALVLQRVYRGYKGRKRLNLKREMVKSIADAKHSVSLHELLPGVTADYFLTQLLPFYHFEFNFSCLINQFTLKLLCNVFFHELMVISI